MDSVFQGAWDFIALKLAELSFLWLCLEGGAVIVAVCALAWFFPVLRSLAGAVVFAIVAALYGYYRGEKDAEAHAKAERDRVTRQQQRQDWRW